jgi:hypothetical protein
MKNAQIPQNVPALLKDQQGSAVLIIALMLPIFLGFAALAVDVGQMMAVKAQLNNAAEAGALSGARGLAPYIGTPPQPNWSNGTTLARQSVGRNYADKQPLTVSEAVAGAAVPSRSEVPPRSQATPCYWRLSDNTTWPTSTAPQDGYVPAMQVTVAKTAGQNGGPLSMMFAQILGYGTKDLVGQAVAMLPSPGAIAPGEAFPFALPYTYVKNHWADNPTDSTKWFTVGSAQQNSSGGQWTSFTSTNNAASYVSGLITNGNPIAIALNDMIYIQTGEENSVYNTAANKFAANPNKIYMLPVVPDGFATGAYAKVVSYVAFVITGVNRGNDPYVQGHFLPNYVDPKATGAGGIYSGTSLPPKLVN